MPPLRSNLVLGAFIGNGHFGEVFGATDDVQGNVAVKILKQQAGESAAEWNRRKAGLLSEGQRLQKAQHKNVVQVFQALESEASDAIHLVMELCTGGSLQTSFDNGPSTLFRIRKVMTEVCLGVDALHSRGMIHRDLKPGNILIDQKGICKVADFGLVTDQLVLGYAGQAGYNDHLPPEVHNGVAGTSVRSDIWALGMTLYRLLHGKEWYIRSPAPRFTVSNGGFARKLLWLPHIPASWRRFIRKLLHDDPHRRFQSIQQVMAALATLEVEPSWICTVYANKVEWTATSKTRRFFVSWSWSGRDHEWEARSEPLGLGNRRHLGGGGTSLTEKQAIAELEDFFATHRH